jgi:hypothetical protein
VRCRQAKAKYCGMPAPAEAFAVPCRQRLKPTVRILGGGPFRPFSLSFSSSGAGFSPFWVGASV